MQQCYFCKGSVIKKVVTHVHTWEGKIFLFEDVPADVCQQCGEIYFSPDILEVMDKIVTSDMEPKTKVAVPVFSISGPYPSKPYLCPGNRGTTVS
jgi:YgiT-type zinc finger domain-containing protein